MKAKKRGRKRNGKLGRVILLSRGTVFATKAMAILAPALFLLTLAAKFAVLFRKVRVSLGTLTLRQKEPVRFAFCLGNLVTGGAPVGSAFVLGNIQPGADVKKGLAVKKRGKEEQGPQTDLNPASVKETGRGNVPMPAAF